MTVPLISIGITCYNAETTIERAINSALAQNWQNYEIIIVDDHSTDGSYGILECLSKQHPDKISITRNDINSGAPASRNRLLDIAKGEFIAFFDDDDESLPSRLSRQYKAIVEHEQSAATKKICCYTSICKKYANGYETHMTAIGSQQKIPKGEDMVRYQLYLERDPHVFYGAGTPSCALMARTELLKQTGGFDPAMRRNEDSELSIRLGQGGTHFIGTKEELVIQYASGGIDKRPEVGYQSELFLIKKYRPILEKEKRYGFAKRWIELRYYHYSGQRPRAILTLLCMLLHNPIITLKRFLKAAPKRIIHEQNMAR